MESFLKDEIKAGGSLLNHVKAKPLSVMAKALHLTGSWYPFSSIESFDLWHSELC